jgi:hypothetical protein
MQGTRMQGTRLQGTRAQGTRAQGASLKGQDLNYFATNGMTLNSIPLNAVDLQRTGMSASRQAQDPNPAVSFDPRALVSLALRGLSEADAVRWTTGEAGVVHRSNLVRLELELDGPSLVAHTLDGQALAREELAGLLLPFSTDAGETAWVTLTEARAHPDVADLPLYTLTIKGESLCEDGGAGFFVPGIWDESGARTDRVDTGDTSADTTFACTVGVIAKCVAWGYRPWSGHTELHQTCTRMARADYCGNGVPHTENGTWIDLYDIRSIQTPVPNDALSFEAGWGPNGAVCVNQPRFVDYTLTGEVLYPTCWSTKPTCDSWSAAQSQGAQLGNDSRHLSRKLDCTL